MATRMMGRSNQAFPMMPAKAMPKPMPMQKMPTPGRAPIRRQAGRKR